MWTSLREPEVWPVTCLIELLQHSFRRVVMFWGHELVMWWQLLLFFKIAELYVNFTTVLEIGLLLWLVETLVSAGVLNDNRGKCTTAVWVVDCPIVYLVEVIGGCIVEICRLVVRSKRSRSWQFSLLQWCADTCVQSSLRSSLLKLLELYCSSLCFAHSCSFSRSQWGYIFCDFLLNQLRLNFFLHA